MSLVAWSHGYFVLKYIHGVLQNVFNLFLFCGVLVHVLSNSIPSLSYTILCFNLKQKVPVEVCALHCFIFFLTVRGPSLPVRSTNQIPARLVLPPTCTVVPRPHLHLHPDRLLGNFVGCEIYQAHLYWFPSDGKLNWLYSDQCNQNQ